MKKQILTGLITMLLTLLLIGCSGSNSSREEIGANVSERLIFKTYEVTNPILLPAAAVLTNRRQSFIYALTR